MAECERCGVLFDRSEIGNKCDTEGVIAYRWVREVGCRSSKSVPELITGTCGGRIRADYDDELYFWGLRWDAARKLAGDG